MIAPFAKETVVVQFLPHPQSLVTQLTPVYFGRSNGTTTNISSTFAQYIQGRWWCSQTMVYNQPLQEQMVGGVLSLLVLMFLPLIAHILSLFCCGLLHRASERQCSVFGYGRVWNGLPVVRRGVCTRTRRLPEGGMRCTATAATTAATANVQPFQTVQRMVL